MNNQTTSQPEFLAYPALLVIAQAESARFEIRIENLKTELFQMSQHYLRSGWHRGFDDYYYQRREVSTKLLYAERDLVRSQARERTLRAKIAEGKVRVPELKVA
jgi:hypothetical protein